MNQPIAINLSTYYAKVRNFASSAANLECSPVCSSPTTKISGVGPDSCRDGSRTVLTNRGRSPQPDSCFTVPRADVGVGSKVFARLLTLQLVTLLENRNPPSLVLAPCPRRSCQQ